MTGLFIDVTVALYTIHSVKHLLSNGHSSGTLQLQVLTSLVGGGVENASVMTANDISHVSHAAVAHFDGVPVEQTPQPMVPREMLINKLKETLGNICFYILIEWWVKPNYVPSSFVLVRFSISQRWVRLICIGQVSR